MGGEARRTRRGDKRSKKRKGKGGGKGGEGVYGRRVEGSVDV